MVKSLQEIKENFWKEFKEFLKKCHEIEARARESKGKNGGEYRGFLDWNDDDYKWYDRTSIEIDGMIRLIGFTEEEVEKIKDSIRRELNLR